MLRHFRHTCIVCCAMLPFAALVHAEESDFVTSSAGMHVMGAAPQQPQESEEAAPPAVQQTAKAAPSEHPAPEIPAGWTAPENVPPLGQRGSVSGFSGIGTSLGGGSDGVGGPGMPNAAIGYALQGEAGSPDGYVHLEDPKQQATYGAFLNALMQYITSQSATYTQQPLAGGGYGAAGGVAVAGYSASRPAAAIAVPARSGGVARGVALMSAQRGAPSPAAR